MNKEQLHFLQLATENLTSLLHEAVEVSEMQEQFHNGGLLSLSLNIGETTVKTKVLTANGKNCFANDLFKTLEAEQKARIALAIADLQTAFETNTVGE